MSILTFNAKTVDGEILEKTLVGRKEIVDSLFDEIHRRTSKKETIQSLIVAPRGSGKTHLTKVLYHRLKKVGELQDKMLIAYMVEDEYGVVNFLHFSIRILEALHRYNELPEVDIPKKIQEFTKIKTEDQLKAITSYIRELLNDRVLIVLVENFDNLLSSMDDKGGALRAFMHNYNSISLIATAQALTPELKDDDNPFYKFFRTRYLESLNFEEAYELILALIEVDPSVEAKQKLQTEINNSDEIKNRLRAIYELTGGNHRLLVHFFSFLKSDIKSELSEQFVKQMNDLKTYYEQFVNNLSVQQQRIVQLLSLNHKPMQGKEIAQQAFLDQKVVSKQLSELNKKNYLDVNKSGRIAFYEIKEPLMRMCFEINENPDGSAKLFVDFLKVLYSDVERKKRYLKFKLEAKHLGQEESQLFQQEARLYEYSFDEETKKEMQKMAEELQTCSMDKLYEEIEKRLTKSSTKEENLEELIIKWTKQIELDPDNADLYYNLGVAFLNKGNWEKARIQFVKALEVNPKNESSLLWFGYHL